MSIAFLGNLALFAGHPPIVIRNSKDLISRVAEFSFKITSIFNPTPNESLEPSKKLLKYIQNQIHQTNDQCEKERFYEIQKKAPDYQWFVAGFISGGRRYLYCYFTVSFSGPAVDYPQSCRSFPVVKDGGTSVCSAIFDLTSGDFVLLRSNGVA